MASVSYSYILTVDIDCKESVRCVKDAICTFYGIHHIHIDLKDKKVHLKGNVDISKVAEAIRKNSNRETKIIHCALDKPEPQKEPTPKEPPQQKKPDATSAKKGHGDIQTCVINNFYY